MKLFSRLFSIVFLFYFLFSISLFYGCTHQESHGLNEGKIIYEVTCVDNDRLNSCSPKEMVVYFKGELVCSILDTGCSVTTIVSDNKKKTYTIGVESPDNKEVVTMNESFVNHRLNSRPGLEITFTGNVKKIAGHLCKEAVINDSCSNSYTVYYADGISDSEEPNWASSFRKIPGLMLEYSSKINDITYSFTAKKIIFEPVNDEVFSLSKKTDHNQNNS